MTVASSPECKDEGGVPFRPTLAGSDEAYQVVSFFSPYP